MHQKQNKKPASRRLKPTTAATHLKPLKYLLFGAFFLLPLILLLNSSNIQRVESLSIKTIAKNVLITRMSQRKNILPVPVPIPVRIELNEPPVYLQGKPKYVTVYKPEAPFQQPVVKPTTVYHMPVYSPTYEYMHMTDPMSVYGGMMMANQIPSQYGSSKYYSGRESLKDQTSSIEGPSDKPNFSDYDDESGSYYSVNSQRGLPKYYYEQYEESLRSSRRRRSDSEKESETLLLPIDEQESLDNHDDIRLKRVKRQISYTSGYEGPCYGFPLEVNVRSRIKMDQLFPIHGNSQYKKCIKVGRPLLPPVEDDHPQY